MDDKLPVRCEHSVIWSNYCSCTMCGICGYDLHVCALHEH